MSQSSEYARRFNAGEIRTKREEKVMSQSEKYAAAHVNDITRAMARKNGLERLKREEHSEWQPTEE